MKINEINSEGKISIKALITKCDKGKTQKNTPYLSLTLEDNTGVLDTKYWNLTDEQVNKYKVGMVVAVEGDVILHRNAYQLRVHKMEIVEENDLSAYVRSAPMTRNAMEAKVNEYITMIKDEDIKTLTKTILQESKDDFFNYPAAVRNHHNFVGGLAFHSISMVELCLMIAKQYPWLDKDLLISGTLLHDIGKIEELSSAVLPEYTIEGNLLGHISIMSARVDRVAHQLNIQDKESVMLIKHMILSHHGKIEFGSPVLPMIPEAEVLSLVDNLDARIVMMKNSLDQTVPGEFGPRVFALENRMIYHRKGSK